MRRYLKDIARVIRQLGALIGTILILLSAPGILALLISGDYLASHTSGALRISIAVVSGLFCAIGVYMVYAAIRISLYFGLRERFPLSGRAKRRAP